MDEKDITLERAKILVQREMVGKILVSLLKNPKQYETTYQTEIKKLTNNKFESHTHLFMHQYNQALEEIMCWHDPQKSEFGLCSLLKERSPNYDLVLETLVQAFADKAWTSLDKNENVRRGDQNHQLN